VLRAGGRFLVNAFDRDSKDGRGVGQFAAVSANEVEQVVRLRERLYQVGESGDVGGGGDSGDELVAEREAPLALIPKLRSSCCSGRPASRNCRRSAASTRNRWSP
jgi:hypothetical protein